MDNKTAAKKYGLTVKQVEAFAWMWNYEFSSGYIISTAFVPGVNHRFLTDGTAVTKNLDYRVLKGLAEKGLVVDRGYSARINSYYPNHNSKVALDLAHDLGVL